MGVRALKVLPPLLFLIAKLNERTNPAEAELAAHVSGDGWLTEYYEANSLQIVNNRRYRRTRRRFEMGYCNTNPHLRRLFERRMKQVYGVKGRTRFEKHQITFRSKRVFRRLQDLGAGNSRQWRVAAKIISSGEARHRWLRAFFDDEATVEALGKRVRIKSVNQRGLGQVGRMLRLDGILSSITGPNSDDTYYLTISKMGLRRYLKVIGFNHLEKKHRLRRVLSVG